MLCKLLHLCAQLQELRDELDSRSLSSKGLKSQLIARLTKALLLEEEADVAAKAVRKTSHLKTISCKLIPGIGDKKGNTCCIVFFKKSKWSLLLVLTQLTLLYPYTLGMAIMQIHFVIRNWTVEILTHCNICSFFGLYHCASQVVLLRQICILWVSFETFAVG